MIDHSGKTVKVDADSEKQEGDDDWICIHSYIFMAKGQWIESSSTSGSELKHSRKQPRQTKNQILYECICGE